MNLIEQVAENITGHDLLAPGARVMVAVSGGVDSMVLLHVLSRLREAHDWKLEVAHFNHQLRAEVSNGDEEFVRATAARLQLPFHADRGDVAGLAEANGISIEMAGRELRHVFLARIAIAQNSFHVALAHHADDQVETFWLRVLRGDVGAGLAGMRWKRLAVDDPRVTLVRPLLNISKVEIADYAKTSGVPFREDLSNADLHFQRNRIRHEILPALARYQPQLRSISLRTAEVLADEKGFLTETAQDWLRTGHPDFETLHTALQREVIRIQLLKTAVTPTFELIENLRTAHDKALTVSQGRTIFRDRLGHVHERPERPIRFATSANSISLLFSGETLTHSKVLSWQFVASRGEREEGVEYFDRDAVGEEIVVRRWRPGDRFQPIGAAQTIKLQDIFTNLKVPTGERRERLVAVAQSGEIFWVEGVRIGEKFKVTPTTKKILRWNWKHTPPTPT